MEVTSSRIYRPPHVLRKVNVTTLFRYHVKGCKIRTRKEAGQIFKRIDRSIKFFYSELGIEEEILDHK